MNAQPFLYAAHAFRRSRASTPKRCVGCGETINKNATFWQRMSDWQRYHLACARKIDGAVETRFPYRTSRPLSEAMTRWPAGAQENEA